MRTSLIWSNRTIGGGTVTGFVETDGTLGVMSSANIVNWELILTSPNLRGGSTETISFATQFQTLLNGSATTATATDLMFDLDAVGSNYFLIQALAKRTSGVLKPVDVLMLVWENT